MAIKTNVGIGVPVPEPRKVRRGWVSISREYEFVPRDVVYAFNHIVAEKYGNGDIRNAVRGIHNRMPWTNWQMPGRQPVQFSNTEVSLGSHRELLVGYFEILGIPGEFGMLGDQTIRAKVPEHCHSEVTRLFRDVQCYLESNGVYRGTMFNNAYQFIDPHAVDYSKLVYNPGVERDLRALVWTLFEKPAECREHGLPFQRKVLFTGGHGYGKTMALMQTAAKAVAHGWTVIHVEHEDEPSKVIEGSLMHARRYLPCMVTIEDFDRENDRILNERSLSQLLNRIDGAMSKTGDIVIIMTTNYPEKIPVDLHRPGRIDIFLDFNRYEQDDRVRLLKRTVPPHMLANDIDWKTVGEAWKDYAPVFVNKIGEHAMMYAISEMEAPMVTEEMLLTAAEGLRKQHNSCRKAMGF